jgi:hypothetical protein
MELAYLTAIPVSKELRLPVPLKLPQFISEKKESKSKSKSS